VAAEFGAELRRAAELQHRFYRGNFAGAPLTERMVQFAPAIAACAKRCAT